MLTIRDKEYIRAICILGGTENSVGPVNLAKKLNVSKECAHQKMHRLKILGYGSYKTREGLLLNEKAIEIVKNEFRRHHALEKFLQDALGISHEDACREASRIDPVISNEVMSKIFEKTNKNSACCCDFSLGTVIDIKQLQNCPWAQSFMTWDVDKI